MTSKWWDPKASCMAQTKKSLEKPSHRVMASTSATAWGPSSFSRCSLKRRNELLMSRGAFSSATQR